MSNPEFYLCDICEERIPKDFRLYVETGTQMDGAGDTESVGFYLDLCGKCYKKLLINILNGYGNKDYVLAKEIYEYTLRMKKK